MDINKYKLNAETVHLKLSHYSENLKCFFTEILTSWEDNNIDSKILNVNLDNINDTNIFFKELFINIHQLGKQSETKLRADNVIVIIDTLDITLPELLMSKSNNPDNVMKEYSAIRDRAFLECFERIRISISLYVDTLSNTVFIEIQNVLLILSRLIKLKYFESFVYNFASYLWAMYSSYQDHRDVIQILLSGLSNISEKLVTFLLWKINSDNKIQFRNLAVTIFSELKNNLLMKKFNGEEIVYVLNILDRQNRFIGQYVDAIPGNFLHDGYIICSQNTTIRPIESEQLG